MKGSEYTLVGVIVFIIVIIGSFFGASPFTVNNGSIEPINPDLSVYLGLHYAQGYFQNYSTPYTISISAANVYYNLSNIMDFNSRGIINTNNKATIVRDGVYRISGTMSFSGGNSGVYEVELFINDLGHPECTFFRDTSSTARGDASFFCIENLKAGDILNIKVKDISTPAQSINIYAFNFNIFEIP